MSCSAEVEPSNGKRVYFIFHDCFFNACVCMCEYIERERASLICYEILKYFIMQKVYWKTILDYGTYNLLPFNLGLKLIALVKY